jgi:phosphatidate cytidylyltransferase
MGNFTKRVISAIIYAGLIIASYFLGTWYFYLLFFVFMIFSLYEFLRMIRLKSIYPYILAAASFISTILSNENSITIENDIQQKLMI